MRLCVKEGLGQVFLKLLALGLTFFLWLVSVLFLFSSFLSSLSPLSPLLLLYFVFSPSPPLCARAIEDAYSSTSTTRASYPGKHP